MRRRAVCQLTPDFGAKSNVLFSNLNCGQHGRSKFSFNFCGGLGFTSASSFNLVGTYLLLYVGM